MHVLRQGCRQCATPFFLLLLSLQIDAAESSNELQTLPVPAIRVLAENPYWHSLLHYKKTWLSCKSTIDDPDFFLSDSGQVDPVTELIHTIQSFSNGDPTDPKHPINRFPARLHWLQQQLPKHIVAQFVAPQSAPFEATYDAIAPGAASLIFPTQYMNNPASLFGHSLINIEGQQNQKLLAYSINYSAITNETNGVVFAVKGIFGKYQGRFSIDPYYQKVQQYSDISMRDIWEYRLNLNKEEVYNLMRHLWELQEMYSYYYFFNENCSYNLLFLLDVARPGSQLVAQFNHWVIPIDTIKAIRTDGFIADETYRPSRSTKIKRIAATLPTELQVQSMAAIESDEACIALLKTLESSKESNETKIRALDLASELLQMHHADGTIRKDRYAERFLTILKQRAKLGTVADDFYPKSIPSPPHEGHDSSRFGWGAGHYDGESVISLSLRPAYHDLMDPSTGYTLGSAIEFLNGTFYYYTDAQKWELRHLDFVRIHSLSPIDTFFKSNSWHVSTGLTTIKDKDRDARHTAFYFESGIGLSLSVCKHSIAYALAESAAYLNRSLDSGHMIGGGASIGLLSEWTPHWRSQLELRHHEYFLGDYNHRTECNLKLAYSLSERSALKLSWGHSRAFEQSWNEFNCQFQLFY